MNLNSKIYRLLRIWNDVDSVRKGKVVKRIGRRVAGKLSRKIRKKLLK